MNIDLPALREIVSRSYAVSIEARYAQPGMTALRLLGPALDQIHEQLAYEMLAKGLTVLASLDPNERLLPPDRSSAVQIAQLPALVHGAATLEVLWNGSMIFLPEATDPFLFADRAVVYYFNGSDSFAVGDQLIPVQNPTSFPSLWGIPTFFDLRLALQHYRDRLAIHCKCPFLSKMWHDSNRRWLLKNKPESTMQESLEQYLVSSLRGHKRIEVRREQPVGGLKPPDIKVTWTLTNRIAFIEVKWMGASVHASEPRVSWRPSENEANAGAAQLVGYLVDNEAETPGYQTMGFLVVFDARRDGVDYHTTELSREQALYYLAREVAYDPDYSALRHDFAKPFRFFMYTLQPVI